MKDVENKMSGLNALEITPSLTAGICTTAPSCPIPSTTSPASPTSTMIPMLATMAPDAQLVIMQVFDAATGGEYGFMSGTSMATPQVAGVTALVLQYLKEQFPEATEDEMRETDTGLFEVRDLAYDAVNDRMLAIGTCSVCRDSYTADFTGPHCAASAYVDVELDSWYHEAIDFWVDNGLMKGMSSTIFARYAAGNGISVEAEGDLSTYTDADSVSEWAVAAFAWAVENGPVTGMTETTLVPAATTNRAQVATVLMRCCALIG